MASHNILFLYICKKHDSVSHAALRLALLKLGVSDKLVEIIESFHERIKVHLQSEGELSEEIYVVGGRGVY